MERNRRGREDVALIFVFCLDGAGLLRGMCLQSVTCQLSDRAPPILKKCLRERWLLNHSMLLSRSEGAS